MSTTTPDLATYRAVHHALREAAGRMAAASGTLRRSDWRRIDAFARYWKGYAGEVLAHHTIEDDVFFPALAERSPVAAELIARTDADHHHLDELMEAINAAVAHMVRGEGPGELPALLGQLAVHMDEHLDFEDDDVIPLFLRHFTGEEYAALEEQAMKSLGLGAQAAYTVPFLVYWTDPLEAAEMLAAAPLPFRILHRLTRRRHARLAATTLGALADPTVRRPAARQAVAA
jgi:hemerythrin-like domain-containing protein